MKESIYLLILSAVIFLSACSSENKTANSIYQSSNSGQVQKESFEEAKVAKKEAIDTNNQVEEVNNACGPNLAIPSGQLKVHFKEVVQGDSILVQDGESVMLVDAASSVDGSHIVSYMKLRGISHIDYLVATHTHDDHIGGMASVINSFSIGKVYMSGKPSESKAYKDMVAAMEAKKLKFSTPPSGTNFNVGETVCTILAPSGSRYEDENDNSIMIKMVHGGISFLLGGDSEIKFEKEMLARNYNISANVLKVSGPGDNSAISKEFLDKVKPQYAIVSVGVKEAAPTQAVISRLENRGAKIYSTLDHGTIILTSNKETVDVEFGLGSGLT